MNKRQIGNTDLWISPLVLGTNVFGWTIDENTSFEILDGFVAGGFDLVDTADVYSRWGEGNKGGESETIIDNWLKKTGNRNKILIATKVGGDMGNGNKGVTTKYIIEEAENSLTRLHTDHIDLYQTHFDDESTPVEEALKAYEMLVRSGKVRWIGTSNMSAGRITEALSVSNKNGYPQYQVLQPEYNLYAREKYEKNYEALCVENNLGVITYFSLASGFLTGKYRSEKDFSKSVRGISMTKYLNDRGREILKALDIVAERYTTSVSAIALAWIIARPSVTAPIVSATNMTQLAELAKASSINLTQDDMDLLNKASKWDNT